MHLKNGHRLHGIIFTTPSFGRDIISKVQSTAHVKSLYTFSHTCLQSNQAKENHTVIFL